MQFFVKIQDGHKFVDGRQGKGFLETTVVTVPRKNANEALNEENHSYSNENMLLQSELENPTQQILIIKKVSFYSKPFHLFIEPDITPHTEKLSLD